MKQDDLYPGVLVFWLGMASFMGVHSAVIRCGTVRRRSGARYQIEEDGGRLFTKRAAVLYATRDAALAAARLSLEAQI